MSRPVRFALAAVIMVLRLTPFSLGCWIPVSEPIPRDWGVPIDLQADPVHPDRWVVATRWGVAVSDDGGASFEFRTQGSLTSLLIDPDDPARFWATTGTESSSRLRRSDDRGRTWREVASFPVGGIWTLAAAFRDGSCLLAIRQYRFGCGYNLELYRGEEGGRSWVRLAVGQGVGIEWVRPVPGTEEVYTKQYSSSMERLYRSTDTGVSWQEITLPAAGSRRTLRALAAGGPDGRELLLLENPQVDGPHLLRSTDAGESWVELDREIFRTWGLEDSDCLAIAPDSTVFLLPEIGYFPSPSTPVARSMDHGRTWVPAVGGLPMGATFLGSVVAPRRLVVPLWAAPGPSALIEEPDGSIRLYRFEPDPPHPRIVLAGWYPDRISASTGGELALQAYVSPVDVAVEVEILHQGLATGVFLEPEEGGLHRIVLNIAPGELQPGYLLIGLIARDDEGRESPSWPHLAFGPTGFAPTWMPPTWMGSPPSGLGGANPSILAGGPGLSGGFCPEYPAYDLAAILTDPDGLSDLDLVEVIWQGLPSGLTLKKGSTSYYSDYRGAFADREGCYGITFDHADIPPGCYLIELQGRDDAGNRTGLWPYLTVDP